MNDLLRNANNTAELTSFNDYINEIETRMKYFLFRANTINISSVKFFLGRCTL